LPAAASVGLLQDRVGVIGYPAFDPRNPADVQNSVFHGVYSVKRLQPGLIGARRTVKSFGNQVNAATHDASTLGGNSGSAVVEAANGNVFALHFGGVYHDANFAVPVFELARDARIVDLGVNFEKPAPDPATTAWWSGVPSGQEAAAMRVAPPPSPPVSAPPLRPTQEPAEPKTEVSKPDKKRTARFTIYTTGNFDHDRRAGCVRT
jgi:endonuclease G, mitochondrial